jgi:formiminotetrahydrofolate cyclodeaminase
MLTAAEHTLQLEGFKRDQVLELRLRNAPLTEAVPIASFLDQVAGPTPTPGGGTVSAFVGAVAACLPSMVANLTLGKKKYAAAEEAMAGIKRDAEGLRRELLALGRRDSEAFDQVLRARRMSQAGTAEVADRDAAMAAADREAVQVPLETARACVRVAELAALAAERGNTNACSDAGVAGLLARAAGEGALLNVQINLKSMPGSADTERVAAEAEAVRSALVVAADRCASAVQAAMNA